MKYSFKVFIASKIHVVVCIELCVLLQLDLLLFDEFALVHYEKCICLLAFYDDILISLDDFMSYSMNDFCDYRLWPSFHQRMVMQKVCHFCLESCFDLVKIDHEVKFVHYSKHTISFAKYGSCSRFIVNESTLTKSFT